MFPNTEADRLMLAATNPELSFEPLRHLKPETVAVIGVVSTKTGVLEDPDFLKMRLQQAFLFHPGGKEQTAIGTQCGFASSLWGNPRTMAEQQAKLELLARMGGLWE